VEIQGPCHVTNLEPLTFGQTLIKYAIAFQFLAEIEEASECLQRVCDRFLFECQDENSESDEQSSAKDVAPHIDRLVVQSKK
jgi:hypothetical protein